ncbi:hypothetical protein [Carboxylicivirga taeanensis]|uniref:hypothetical protein n=1 Tax=Carboxylicivirga taeanensis TaxID=1416875 RepID=UPI003F6DC0C4
MAKLYTLEGHDFVEKKSLSEESRKSLLEDCDLINTYSTQLEVFQYLQNNLSDYNEFLTKISGIPITKFNFQAIENTEFIIEVNKHILNILSSFKFFLDNAESYIKRHVGKDSQQILDFKELTSKLYDSYFSYRFLYRLRNYAMHLGFPIQSIHFKSRKQEANPEDMIGDVILEVSIMSMQGEKKLFGPVHKELMNINSNIDIRPLIVELSKSILTIQKFMHSIHTDKLNDAIANIELYTLKYKTTSNIIVIIDNFHVDDEKVKLTKKNIPFDRINKIKILNNNWC